MRVIALIPCGVYGSPCIINNSCLIGFLLLISSFILISPTFNFSSTTHYSIVVVLRVVVVPMTTEIRNDMFCNNMWRITIIITTSRTFNEYWMV